MRLMPTTATDRSPQRLGILACVWVLALLSVTIPGNLAAQEMGLPVESQWSLFDRILAFDRTFKDRTRDQLVVGVLFQEANRASRNARNDILEASLSVPSRMLRSETIRFVSLEASTAGELRRRLEQEGVDILYVTPLRAHDIAAVSQVSGDLGVVTMTGVREYVEDGIGLGLGMRGGRPEILVNLDVCRKAGMDLSSELLKLATVLASEPDGP